jgi:ligand-binding SRPBCC domain-containing protein
VIERSVHIRAPLERVFAFVTDIRNHGRVVPPQTQERLLDAGDIPMSPGTVDRLSMRCLGVRRGLATRVTAYDPPGPARPGCAHFRDEKAEGPFAAWSHDHWFAVIGGGTRLTDRLAFSAPCGFLGRVVERTWLEGYMTWLLDHMQAAQKRILEAEGDE